MVGGLIGTDDSTIAENFDYATGSVTGGSKSDVGGLIGAADGAGAEYDFATGAVSGGGKSDVGGLIGLASNVALIQDYTTSAVSGGTGSTLGGVIGNSSGGEDSDVYWDLTTSGLSNGFGNSPNGFGVTGLTTAQFQSGLPGGFSSSYWGTSSTINGGLPYLLGNLPR